MFSTLFTEISERNKQFTVYRDGEQTAIETQFATHNVAVTHETLPPGGPDPFVVIEEDDTFRGAIALADLETLIEPPIIRPGDRDEVSRGYQVLFEVLDETVFAAMNRRQLLAVSREIEDRAFRVGNGTLRVSFQTLSTFKSQAKLYRQLASSTDLDIHIYGIDDWTPPVIPGITYHELTADLLGQYWVLAFDGGSIASQASALVAQEQRDGYNGVWTDDTKLVDDILAELAAL